MSQTNCIRCTIALNRRIKKHFEETGERVRPEQIANFSTKHPGVCYKNSNLHPASAEEYQAVAAARDLLLNADGKYLGDNAAIFGAMINADNDTRAPSAFIREQNRIMGEASGGLVARHEMQQQRLVQDADKRPFFERCERPDQPADKEPDF